jgi:hypothetical protein
MKNISFFLASLVFFAGCKPKGLPGPYLPVEYTLDEADKQKGKTMVYIDRSSNQYEYTDLFYIQKNNRQYLVDRERDSSGVTDSTIYYPTRMMETYSTLLEDSLLRRLEILKDTILNNGKKLGKYVGSFRTTNDLNQIDISVEQEYLKDTVFTWNAKSLPTLVLKTHYDFIIKHLPTGRSMSTGVDSHIYFAKGIGHVKTVIIKEEKNVGAIDLVEIRDLQR